MSCATFPIKRLLLPFICLTVIINSCSENIRPVQKKIGRLSISIDPRIELLSAVQVLSNYKYINRNSLYSKEISDFFRPYALDGAVELTNKMEEKNNFIYAAPVQFMLNLSALPGLSQCTSYSGELIKRAGGIENLDTYRNSLRQFASSARFKEFWGNNILFYQKVLDHTMTEIKGTDLVKVVEDYFNETQNSYNLIISTLSRGSYSYRIKASGNSYDVYSCNVTRNEKDGIPFINRETVLRNATHEFSHSFVDHLTELYDTRVDRNEALFNSVRSAMEQQGYGTWKSCVNEHIVRAINIRIQELNYGEDLSRKMLQEEKGNQFIYIDLILKKLEEFESSRRKRNITFSEFYPQFLVLFDSLNAARGNLSATMVPSEMFHEAEKTAQRSAEISVTASGINFSGPIDGVFKQKLAWIYPTLDIKRNVSEIHEYVSFLFKKIKKENSILIPDTVALKTDLSGYGLMVYGTIESNAFLLKYRSVLPFRVMENSIIADKVYQGEDIKLIMCLPNPINPINGMVVHTASSNKYIRDINNVKHGDEDYIIFRNRNAVFSRGYYNKSGNWGSDKN